MSRSIRVAAPDAQPADRAPLALERVVPFFVALAVVGATFVPPSAFAATRDWTLSRTPASVSGTSGAVQVTAANVGDDGGGEAVGCVVITIPNVGFTVTGVTVDLVSDGDVWLADFAIGATDTTVRLYASSGGGERLHGVPSESVQATVAFDTTGSDGTYTWTGNAFNKEDCTDDFLLPRTVSVTVNGGAPNSAPTAADDAYATAKGVAVGDTAPGVLGNDADADGDPLTATLVSTPASGSVVLAADGSFTYTPNAGYTGTDTFVYRASDGSLTSADATVSINVTNTPPASAADSYSAPLGLPILEGAPGVLGNDTDANGDTLSAVLVSGPSNGSLTLDPDGSFSYVPDLLYVGPDSFVYRASDGTDVSSDTVVSLNVVNTPPVATGDGPYSVAEDDSLSVPAPGVLTNDADAEGNPMTALLVSGPADGTLTMRPDGSFDYTPNADFNGVDGFTYRASDGVASSSAVAVTLDVTAVNDPPVASDETYSVAEDGTLTVVAPGGVLANDADIDGDPLAAALVDAPTLGTVALAGDGSFTYTPDPDAHGADAFTYRVTDGNGGTATAVARVNVTAVNDSPVARDDAATTAHATGVTVDALANDLDVDGDSLALESVGTTSAGSTNVLAGKVRFVPSPTFVGTTTVIYTVGDGIASDTGTITITVSPAPPTPTPAPSAPPTPTPTPAPVAPAPVLVPSPSPSPSPVASPRSGGAVTPATPAPSPRATPAAVPVPAPSADALAPREVAEMTTRLPSGSAAPFSFTSLFGAFGGGFAWAAPAVMLTVPGLLFMFVVIAQVVGAAAWVPAVRRSMAGIGFSRRRRSVRDRRPR